MNSSENELARESDAGQEASSTWSAGIGCDWPTSSHCEPTITFLPSGTGMMGRPGHHTMEMNGRSTASYLVRAPRVAFFMLILIGLEAKGLLAFQGERGIASVVRWSLHPVIFGVNSKTPVWGEMFREWLLNAVSSWNLNSVFLCGGKRFPSEDSTCGVVLLCFPNSVGIWA